MMRFTITMKRYLQIFSLIVVLGPMASFKVLATNADPACFMVSDLKTGMTLVEQGDCQSRTPPNSTFKIPLAVMGFDTGILENPNTPVWNYDEKYSAVIPVHKNPQTPKSWVNNSAVWYSQELTQKMGKAKFQQYVDAFAYGNRDLSGNPGENNGLTHSWLSSSLQVSPGEQIAFLRKLINNELPVSAQAQAFTREILFLGILPNETDWKMYGKTGSGWQRGPDGVLNPDRQFGWFIGWAVKDDRQLIFTYLIKDEDKNPEFAGPRAREGLTMALEDFLSSEKN